MTGNAPVYYQYDGHGSVVQLTDATGTVIKNYDYDAFGNDIVQSYDDANPFRYSGEYFDDETDLYYLRARYYWPSLGQFTQEDTYRGEPNNPNSLNLYTYCYNDPVQYVDRSGNTPEVLLDVASLTYSAKAYREDPSFGNAISYYWDLGAVFIPILPGSYAGKALKWLFRGENAADAARAIDRGVDLSKKLRPQSLMDELASSGVKYNSDSVIMVTKTYNGELLWLEQGNEKTGLTHILKRHASDFASQGIDDVSLLLNDVLQTVPTKIGSNAKGKYADYLYNGNMYRVAYGFNGYIVSFYPID